MNRLEATGPVRRPEEGKSMHTETLPLRTLLALLAAGAGLAERGPDADAVVDHHFVASLLRGDRLQRLARVGKLAHRPLAHLRQPVTACRRRQEHMYVM